MRDIYGLNWFMYQLKSVYKYKTGQQAAKVCFMYISKYLIEVICASVVYYFVHYYIISLLLRLYFCLYNIIYLYYFILYFPKVW